MKPLLVTYKLQGINLYVYLVDVLQRIDWHPARDVYLLTPRLWKQHFADSPLRLAVDTSIWIKSITVLFDRLQ